MTSSPNPATPALARLLRWQDAGGTWLVIGRSDTSASVSLCRCDGGEEVERFTSSEPELVAFLGSRDSSEDAES